MSHLLFLFDFDDYARYTRTISVVSAEIEAAVCLIHILFPKFVSFPAVNDNMILLFLLVPAAVQPAPQFICPCTSASACEPTAKLSLYRKMKRISPKATNASIEVNLELQISGKLLV